MDGSTNLLPVAATDLSHHPHDHVPAQPESADHMGVLISFWYYGRFDVSRIPTSVRVIADSGAFSAWTSGSTVSVPGYAAWLDLISDRVDFAFNLDVIGDEEGSYRQWVQLQREFGHTTVPVIHYGDRPEAVIPRYLEGGATRFAISGGAMRTVPVRQRLAWQALVHKWFRDHAPTVPLHGLGVHMRSPLARLPWDTIDASSFSMTWRMGRLALWSPRRGWRQVELNGRDIYKHGPEVRSYGFEPEEVAVSTSTTRPKLVRLATRIETRAAAHFNATRSPDRPLRTYLADSTSKDMMIEAEELAR